MKTCHVALVVSALAMTASGASIGRLPPMPLTLSENPQNREIKPEIQSIHRRRSTRGPLARMLKRSPASKYIPRQLKRAFPRRYLDNQLPSFEEYINSVNRPYNADLQSNSAKSTSGTTRPAIPIATGGATITSPGAIPQGDIPGFVDIALPDPRAGLARTVSGLAYSIDSGSENGELELGTSPSHSTQFFLSPVDHTSGSSLYRLRVPTVDSTTSSNIDHCATFPVSPPGPMSLRRCGHLPGYSQSFSYDSISGELQPVYLEASTPDFTEGARTAATSQTNKRQLSTDSKPVPSTQTKIVSPQSSAVLYFVPADSAKTQVEPTNKKSDR